MYEILFYKAGILLGMYVLVSLFSAIYLIEYIIFKKNVNKFLLETKQHQKYQDWRSKNGKAQKRM